MTMEAEKTTGMDLRWRLLFYVLFFGPAIYFAVDGDYPATAICAVAGIAAFGGYRAGAVSIVTLLAAVTAAIAFAPSLGQSQEARFATWFGTTGLTNRFLSIGAIGAVISMVIAGLGMFISGKLLRPRPRLDSVNRWIGFGIGGVEGVAASIFFLGGMLMIEPIEKQRAELRDAEDVRGNLVSEFILDTSEGTRDSRIGPALVDYNPFTRIPQLNRVEELQQSVQVLSDPKKIEGLLEHPSIRQLQQRPEVRRAVQKLTDDPEIQEVLRSGKRMDRSMAMTLLNHPAVMELVDQPEFLEHAARAIESTPLLWPTR